ncbi:hypothetical protein HanPI659440_Chr13g0486601 [Helianthus annuus]|nr:hypothetical protein HanPI659440_Chr13g0486601 [Helianthus annuus]
MGKSPIILVAFLLISVSIRATAAYDATNATKTPPPAPKYQPTPVPAPKQTPPPAPKPMTPPPAPKPKTPAPAPKPKTPPPAPKPKTPPSAPKPKTPVPAPKPKTPPPAPKPKTPPPAPKPKTPPPAPKPKTPPPAPKPKTPPPAPKPKTPPPAPKPKTPPPAPKPKTPPPAPKPKTPPPAPKPKTPPPAPKPKTPPPAPKPKTPPPAPKPKPPQDDTTNYDELTPEPGTGRQRAFCKSKVCYYKTLTCPKECPERKPKKNKRNKACFINCGRKCEATCKWRRPKCNGYGSLCYDPRFIGGDGVMFYFHGGKGRDFALVSDTNLQINAHFIGSRPNGRRRDYTWVQSVSIMFDTHTLIISVKNVEQWDDSVDTLLVKWDGEEVTVPFDGEAEWKTDTGVRQVAVERTDDTNAVKVTVGGLVSIHMKAVPVTKEDDKAHNYQLPSNDAFAHFELQFEFPNLSNEVEGILGKTYRPGYVSPVKRGIAMPIMGGEDKYETPSLTSTNCKLCRFQSATTSAAIVTDISISQY